MGLLGKIFAPAREAKIRAVRDIAERETYKAFKEDGNFTEEECQEEARSIAQEIDDNLRGKRHRRR